MLDPHRSSLHYEYARTDQLFGRGAEAAAYFASAQRLAIGEWREGMGCDSTIPATITAAGGPTDWRAVANSTPAVREATLYHTAASPPRFFGRTAPRPYSKASWPLNAHLEWPSLRFADRSIAVAVLQDVWVSGNDGVVTDKECNVYLPSHGFQV